jgi:hypothetical protein
MLEAKHKLKRALPEGEARTCPGAPEALFELQDRNTAAAEPRWASLQSHIHGGPESTVQAEAEVPEICSAAGSGRITDQGGASRRRGPGVSGRLCLGGPPAAHRATLTHATQIKMAPTGAAQVNAGPSSSLPTVQLAATTQKDSAPTGKMERSEARKRNQVSVNVAIGPEVSVGG